jgi:hypothetical protein
MFRSSLLLISICVALIACDAGALDQFGSSPVAPMNPTGMPGMPGGPSMPPGPQPRRDRDVRRPAVADEAVTAASEDIRTRLNALLAVVNQGREPNVADLTPIAEAVRKDLPLLPKMDAKGQANLQVLNAWMNFFGGDLKRAKIAANAAYRADQQNKDALTTYIVMNIANNDIRNVKNTITLLRRKIAKPAAGANQEVGTSGGEPSPAVLEFDVNSVKVELLGDKVAAFDAACLNGTSFSFKGGKTLLMLLWANESVGQKPASEGSAPSAMMPGMPGMGYQQGGQTLSPIEAYAALFASDFQNNKIEFLGLNLDAASQSDAVMATLMKHAWPWPQVMAQDPRNASLTSFAQLHSGKPLLVVVGPDGEIKYAGPLAGFMLRAMASHAQSGPEMQPAAAETAKTPEEANAPEAPEPAVTAPNETNIPAAIQQPVAAAAAPQPRKVPKSDEERINPAATDLYQFAVSQKRMAHITGYGTMVNACRQILREYPDAPEAEKARQLLREIPENKRQQFHITNEEMGL